MQNTEKRPLREKILKQRSDLPASSWVSKSTVMQQRILKLEQWRQAQCVLLYAAFRQEADTRLLLENSLTQGRITLLPRCVKGSNALELAAISNPGQLVSGAYGIPEPDPARCPRQTQPVPEIVVLPGVGFDRQGFRLGYGGGYYDRLLDSGELGTPLRIGLCFDFQLLDTLPTDSWDKPVHAICTEERLLWI